VGKSEKLIVSYFSLRNYFIEMLPSKCKIFAYDRKAITVTNQNLRFQTVRSLNTSQAILFKKEFQAV
jgi:hypothetical protein